jgi:predicted O-methyltransferase YrrM
VLRNHSKKSGETKSIEGIPGLVAIALHKNIAFTPDGGTIPLRDSISISEAKHLYDVLRRVKPQSSLELGFATGISTLTIVKALEDNNQGHHHVVDPEESDYKYAGVAMVERAKLSHRMTFHEKYLEEIYSELPALDFVFIDNGHLFDIELLHFVLADKKLKVGGFIGFHDAWMPSQAHLLRYILSNRAYTLCNPNPPLLGWQKIKANLTSKYLLIKHEVLRREYSHNKYIQLMNKSAVRWPRLALLQKISGDDRPWYFHTPF